MSPQYPQPQGSYPFNPSAGPSLTLPPPDPSYSRKQLLRYGEQLYQGFQDVSLSLQHAQQQHFELQGSQQRLVRRLGAADGLFAAIKLVRDWEQQTLIGNKSMSGAPPVEGSESEEARLAREQRAQETARRVALHDDVVSTCARNLQRELVDELQRQLGEKGAIAGKTPGYGY